MAVNLEDVVWSVPSMQGILVAQREAAAQMAARQGATPQQQEAAVQQIQQLASGQRAVLSQDAAQQMIDRQLEGKGARRSGGGAKPLYAMSPQELWAGIQAKLPEFKERMAAAKARWMEQNAGRPGNDKTQWDIPELLSLVEQMPDGASMGIDGVMPRSVTPDILKKLYGMLYGMPGYTAGNMPYASIEEMVAKEAEQTRILQEKGVSPQQLAARQQYLDSTTPEQRWQSLLDQQDASLANAFRDGARTYNQMAQRDIDQNNYMRAKDNPNDPSKFNGGPTNQGFMASQPRSPGQQNSGWNPNTGSFYAPSESAAQIIRQQQALDDYARTGQWNYAGTRAPTELFSGDFLRDVASQEAWGKNIAPMPTFQQFTSQATDPSGRSYSQYDTAGYDKAMADWRNQALASFMDYRQQGNQGWQSYGDPAIQQWLDQQKQQIAQNAGLDARTSLGAPIESAATGLAQHMDAVLTGKNSKGQPLTDGNIFQFMATYLREPFAQEALPWAKQWWASAPFNAPHEQWAALSTEQRQAAQYNWAKQGAEMMRQYAAQNPNWKQDVQAAAQRATQAYGDQQWNDWMQSTGQPALDKYRQQGTMQVPGQQGGNRRSFLAEQRMPKQGRRNQLPQAMPQAMPQPPTTQQSFAPLPSVAPRSMTTVAPQQQSLPVPQPTTRSPQVPEAPKPPQVPATPSAAQPQQQPTAPPPTAPPPTPVQQTWEASKQPNATARQRWGLR